jgi:hypothetical protein
VLGRRGPFVVGAVLGLIAGVSWFVAINVGRAFSGAHVRVDQTPRRILLEVAALVLVVAGPVALGFFSGPDGTRTRMARILGILLVACGALRFVVGSVPERLMVQTSVANASTVIVGLWLLVCVWRTRRGGAVRPVFWIWTAVHVAAATALIVTPVAPAPHGPPVSAEGGHAAAP